LMRSPVPPDISLINSERPPFDLYLNAGTVLRGSKKASAPATGASSQAPPPNAPQWYRMTDAGHPYFWHAPTGATTWNEPGGSVWRECAAPELGGRQVFVWDGVAVQGG